MNTGMHLFDSIPFSFITAIFYIVCGTLRFQKWEESIGPLERRKEHILSEYNDLKNKLGIEEEEQAERKRSYQQEVDLLLKLTSNIKE